MKVGASDDDFHDVSRYKRAASAMHVTEGCYQLLEEVREPCIGVVLCGRIVVNEVCASETPTKALETPRLGTTTYDSSE